MVKLLLLAGTCSLFLTAPVLAAPSPMLQLKLSVDSSGHVRRYTLKLVEDQCGRVVAKTGKNEDDIKVCARIDPKVALGVRLDVGWFLREGDTELRSDSSVIVAHGGWVDFDGGTAKLTIALQ